MTLHFIPWHLFRLKVNSLYPSTSFLVFSILFSHSASHSSLFSFRKEWKKRRIKEEKKTRRKTWPISFSFIASHQNRQAMSSTWPNKVHGSFIHAAMYKIEREKRRKENRGKLWPFYSLAFHFTYFSCVVPHTLALHNTVKKSTQHTFFTSYRPCMSWLLQLFTNYNKRM